MAEALICDCGCGDTVPLAGAAGWLRLERSGIVLTGFGDDDGPWDFSGLDHVEAWARQRIVDPPPARQPGHGY